MLYRSAITVTSGTGKDNPMSQTLPISFGDINQVMIEIPAGIQGLAGCRIKYHEHVAWPEQMLSWFTGDDEVITIPEKYNIYEKPYELEIEAYNEDDTYNHTLTVRVNVVYPEKLWLALIYAELQRISKSVEKPKKAPVVIFKQDLLKPEPWRS